jgi:DnaJ-class molecular chaperone
MPGRHLGRRLPFDVPERSPAAPDDPVTAAFDRLGLARDASSEEVRDAYREQVKEAHPDHGGDREEFTALREAYATAKNHAD